MGMSREKEEEYRNHAMIMLGLALRQPVSAEKSRLMALAEAWLNLAERAARSPVARLQRATSKDAADSPRMNVDTAS
jgi:hypothetical protein